MAFFIFTKNSHDTNGTLYRIAENQSDLNNLNLNISDYEIKEDQQSNFNLVKFGNKYIEKYNSENIIYVDETFSFKNKNELQEYINKYKIYIKQFTDNNPSHPLYNRWNNYYNQLNNFNLDSVTYPLNKSLEQYFNDLGQPSFHILQLP